MSDDITFCMNACEFKGCMRHPGNIQDRSIPHSFSFCKGTDMCVGFYSKDGQVDKAKLIAKLRHLEQFNAAVPEWVYKVIEGMETE